MNMNVRDYVVINYLKPVVGLNREKKVPLLIRNLDFEHMHLAGNNTEIDSVIEGVYYASSFMLICKVEEILDGLKVMAEYKQACK